MLIHWIDYNNKWFLKKSQEIENKDDIWNEFVKEPKCSHIMISKNGKLIQSSKDLECLEENDNEFFTIVNKTNSIPRPINPQDNNYHFLNSILNSALPELRQLFGEENHIEINDNGQIEIGQNIVFDAQVQEIDQEVLNQVRDVVGLNVPMQLISEALGVTDNNVENAINYILNQEQ